MAQFRIKHTRAGAFSKDQIVSDKQIKDSGADLDFWKQTGAVEEVEVLTKTEAQENGVAAEITDPSAAARDAVDAAKDAATQMQQDALARISAAAKGKKPKTDGGAPDATDDPDVQDPPA